MNFPVSALVITVQRTVHSQVPIAPTRVIRQLHSRDKVSEMADSTR